MERAKRNKKDQHSICRCLKHVTQSNGPEAKGPLMMLKYENGVAYELRVRRYFSVVGLRIELQSWGLQQEKLSMHGCGRRAFRGNTEKLWNWSCALRRFEKYVKMLKIIECVSVASLLWQETGVLRREALEAVQDLCVGATSCSPR